MPPATLTVCGFEAYNGERTELSDTTRLDVDPSDFNIVPYSLGFVRGARAFLMPIPGTDYALQNPFRIGIYVRETKGEILGGASQAFAPAAQKRDGAPHRSAATAAVAPRRAVAAAGTSGRF